MVRRTRESTKTKMQTRAGDPALGIDCPEIDPEGWMAERPNYWMELPDPESPTRAAWLRHRMREAALYLGLAAPEPPPERIPEEAWIRLSETALGPLPRPAPLKSKQPARPAPPDAQGSARKPLAYSPAKRTRAPAAR